MAETMYVPASVDCGTKLNANAPEASVASVILRWNALTCSTSRSVALGTGCPLARSFARPVIAIGCVPYDVAGDTLVTSPVYDVSMGGGGGGTFCTVTLRVASPVLPAVLVATARNACPPSATVGTFQ